MNSLDLITKLKYNELRLGDFIYVYKNNISEENKIGFLRYNGVEILGLEQFENDLLTNNEYHFTIKSQEDVLETLDNVEKRYLNHFLAPYKQRIEYIEKSPVWLNNKEYERIIFVVRKTKKHPREIINLPIFKKGTMYKNMETDKQYKFKDLIKW